MATTLHEDPAPLIEAGTCSEDWLRRLGGDPFALVCELPYYTAPALSDTTPAGRSRRQAVLAGIERAAAMHAECERYVAAFTPRDHRLTRAVMDYLAKTPKRLAAERAHAATPEYAREATRAEALDATVCRAFYHMLPLGEVYRLAELEGEQTLASQLRARVAELASTVERESNLTVLPIRPLVAVQAGAGLLAMAENA
jgi:hypothetical protein